MMTSVSDERQTWIKMCAVLNSKLIQGSASDSTQNRALGLIDKKGNNPNFVVGVNSLSPPWDRSVNQEAVARYRMLAMGTSGQ